MSDWLGEAYERIAEVGDLIGAWLEWHVSKVVEENAVRIVVLALVGLIAVQALALLNVPDEDLSWLGLVLKNVGPELAGIVFGVVAIDLLNERRQDEQLKEQLILQMGSSHNDVTDTAISALRARGWLSDGSLSGARLRGANLSRANLRGANLSGADLWDANLSGVDLRGANLSGARLLFANVSGAVLRGANLSGADLEGADLSGANLEGANLSGAILIVANLSMAALWNADLSGARLLVADLSHARLMGANLSGADLERAKLSGADLSGANLGGARDWAIKQLEQAKTLGKAVMPNGVRLVDQEHLDQLDRFLHSTFEEWKAQYLADHGGTVTDIRDESDWDYTEEVWRSESSPP